MLSPWMLPASIEDRLEAHPRESADFIKCSSGAVAGQDERWFCLTIGITRLLAVFDVTAYNTARNTREG